MTINKCYWISWVALVYVSVLSCSNQGQQSNSDSLSRKSMLLLSYDTLNFQKANIPGFKDHTFSESEILRITGESVINMNSGWLFSAYSTNSSLLKSISRRDSAYFQVLFHQFLIANEVDSLKECYRLVQSLGDSSNAGATWQWQQSYMWMRIHARSWNVPEYQKQKTILLQLVKDNPMRLIENAITYEQLGHYECNFRKADVAFLYYEKAILAYQALGWTKRRYLCQIRYADELLYEGKQAESLKVLGQIPDVSRKWPEIHCRKLLFYSELAFNSLNRDEEQRRLFQLYDYALKKNLIFWATEAVTRLASWHMENRNHPNRDSVIHYANLTYRYATDLQDKNFMANASVDLSTAEALFGNYDKAIAHAIDNLHLRKMQNHLHEEIKAYVRISDYYFKKRDIQQAVFYNDSALLRLEEFPEERPYLSNVYKQRVDLESSLGNFELAYKFRKKYSHWRNEGQLIVKEGFKFSQIRQYETQLFKLSNQLSNIHDETLTYKRLNRYIILLILFVLTIILLWVYNKWYETRQLIKSNNEELENERFQLSSIRDDYEHERNQTKHHAIELGNQLQNYLANNWNSDALPETQKRLHFWLKALNGWFKS